MRFGRIHPFRCVPLFLLALAVLSQAAPAGATTLIRQGLERLSLDNEMIVHGKVTSIRSYWNDDHSFILTDVTVRPEGVLKGRFGMQREVTFTLLGGTVGDVTALIIGGPDLVPGSEYVLFLGRDNLILNKLDALTIRDHVQGVFDVVRGADGVRAVSQAIHHPLLPDADGVADAPGGRKGLALDAMLQQIKSLAGDR